MKLNPTTLSLLCAWLFAAFTSSVFASESSVNLVATVRNGPAMMPVEWKIYRMDNNVLAGESAKKHSMSLQLRPGTYKAIASTNTVSRDRIFTVSDNGKVDVVIAMDK